MALDWGTIPAWGATMTAVVGVGLALRQFRLAREVQENQVQIARANLLLTIDKTFEGEDISRSRKAVRSLRNRVETGFKKNSKQSGTNEQRRLEIAAKISEELNALWELGKQINDADIEEYKSEALKALKHYQEIMALPFWMETVGMLCKRRLLPKEDVLDLYDEVIITTLQNFQGHIMKRREDPPYHNRRFMESAYWLLSEAQTYKLKRDEPPPAHPVASRTRWF